jgi:hypothetical protein
MGDGVDHGPALALLFNNPIQKLIRLFELVRRDVKAVILMLVMLSAHKAMGGFVEVVIGPDAVLMGYLSQHLYILEVGPANINVEEKEIPVLLLLFHKIPELRFNVQEGLG